MKGFYLLLLCFWIYLAYGAFQRGSTGTAVVYLAIGVALTTWRFNRSKAT